MRTRWVGSSVWASSCAFCLLDSVCSLLTTIPSHEHWNGYFDFFGDCYLNLWLTATTGCTLYRLWSSSVRCSFTHRRWNTSIIAEKPKSSQDKRFVEKWFSVTIAQLSWRPEYSSPQKECGWLCKSSPMWCKILHKWFGKHSQLPPVVQQWASFGSEPLRMVRGGWELSSLEELFSPGQEAPPRHWQKK